MPPRPRRPKHARIERRIEASIILNLFDLANHLHRGGERLAATVELTTHQWLVLLQIAGDPNFPASPLDAQQGVLASEIARARGVSRATISANVAALRDRGLIDEVPDPEDRRRRHLVLTAAGAAAVERVEPVRQAANLRLVAGFDVAERKRLLSYLERCLGVLWDLHEHDQVTALQSRLARRK